MRKSVLSILAGSVLISSCGGLPKWLPPVPDVNQCGIHADLNPPGFYCVHSRTKKRTYKPFNDPSMKGGQAVSAGDYRKGQNWVDDAKAAVVQNCR